MTDHLTKYLTTDHSTRIQTLRLEAAWQTGLAHQSLPPAITTLLGELSAACVLLAGNIKFEGSVILQLQGNGPVSLIMVECTASLELRATAHLREHASLPTEPTLQNLLNADGQGRFMVMLDPASRHEGASAYQGIVPLEGDSVAAVLEHYMQHSEQLDTRLWLVADDTRCAGLLLQRMPAQDTARDEETWARCTTLAQTLKLEELLVESSETLVHRLFWEEDLLAFPAEAARWHCPCSRERVADMLRTLGQPEVDSIIEEQGQVDITCNFCGQPYTFDAVDCAALFHPEIAPTQSPGSDLLH